MIRRKVGRNANGRANRTVADVKGIGSENIVTFSYCRSRSSSREPPSVPQFRGQQGEYDREDQPAELPRHRAAPAAVAEFLRGADELQFGEAVDDRTPVAFVESSQVKLTGVRPDHEVPPSAG